MCLSGSKRLLLIAALFALALPALSAQQITYYDFDIPYANPTQVSYACGSLGEDAVIPLFCFNDATGANTSPSFLSDTYPPFIDPNPADNPPAQSTHYATQLTFSQSGQDASMWFYVPQNVANGFTSWFAFKITPNPESATADGIAFVIQNASGGGTDLGSGCGGMGSGPTVVGGGGGCMGYSGIDNSLALEFDTFQNSWDPNNNHIALQNCGAGLPNSADHDSFLNSNEVSTTCLVSLTGSNGPVSTLISSPQTSAAPPATATAVTLADGNVHQVVMVYSGPNEATPNLLQVYLDPVFDPGTHTPVTGSVPVFSGTYNLSTALNLVNGNSAYVGFTSATGAAFEQHELMAWTFTPHTTATQQEPLNPPATPTVFPFGTHTYSVNYPANGPSTSGITMVVTANTISPLNFSQLIAQGPTQFAGTQCQVYDDTGGNCVIYSVSCVYTGTTNAVACPSTISTSNFIDLIESYNNSIQPVSPGFLQGDPLYTAISSIVGDGSTTTVTCGTPVGGFGPPLGECSVTVGQTVTILGAAPASLNGSVTVTGVTAPNVFTFASSVNASSTTGGYLTSNNVQNIFLSYSPENIDGSSTGKTQSFSDFVATSVTTVPSQTQLSAFTTSPLEGTGDLLTATVTAQSTQVPGPGNMPTGTIPAIAPSIVTFSTGTYPNLIPITGCAAVLVTPTTATTGTATCDYTPGSTGPVTVTAQYADVYHGASSSTLNLNVAPPYDTAILLTFGDTTLTYPGTTTASVCITPATSATATGSVRLYDSSTLLTTLTLAKSCAKWTITPSLAAGIHTMTADYSGDRNNPAGNSAPVFLTVNPAPVLMVPLCGPSSVAYGSNYVCAVGLVYDIGLVKGTLDYTLDGGSRVTVPVNLGIAVFSITKPIPARHTLVISFPAQTNFAAAGPETETFTVTVAPVTVTLTPSTKSTTSGSIVSFTAAVTSSSAGAPSAGSVSFYDGTTLLTTVPVNGSGAATYATSALPVGSDTIKATYGGSTDYGTGSASVTITIKK
jgi:hypothetical protein